MGDLDRVKFGGVTVDRRTRDMLIEAQRLANLEDPSIGKFKLCQGCWSHASASAGTHGGPGAFDMYTAGFSGSQKEAIGMALRTVGFASWRRRESQGPWQEHWHGIAMGTEGLPPIATGQVTSYLNGGNGLKGNGRDTDDRPEHIRDWEAYQKARGPVDHEPTAGEDARPEKPAEDPSQFEIDPGVRLDTRRDSDSDGLTDDFEKLAGTNVSSQDTDHDGLADGYEAMVSHTDPLSSDTDGDGQTDWHELRAGSEPGRLPGMAGVVGVGAFAENVRGGVRDADQDGLSDHVEKLVGTDGGRSDSDRDQLSDSAEAALGTDPTRADSDYDGLTDGFEVQTRGDPRSAALTPSGRTVPISAWTLEGAYQRRVGEQPVDPFRIEAGAALGSVAQLAGVVTSDPDSDADGLTDAFEKLAGTDAKSTDSDSDGLTDGYEAVTSHTDPLVQDTDRDGTTDATEMATGGEAGRVPGWAGVVGAGAFAENVRGGVEDADQDGLSDHTEKVLRTDATKADSDEDSLDDAAELALHTNPRMPDSDSDGLIDGVELRYHTDPLNPASVLSSGLGGLGPPGPGPDSAPPGTGPAELFD